MTDDGNSTEELTDGPTIAVLTTRIAELERQVAAQDHLLRDMGEIARVGAWELDPLTTRIHGNAEAAAIFDLDPSGTFDQDDILPYFPAAEAARLSESLAEAARAGAPFDLELRVVTAAKRSKWLRVLGYAQSVEGRVTLVRGAVQDISQKKQVELALLESDSLVRGVLRTVSDEIFVLDEAGFDGAMTARAGEGASDLLATAPVDVRAGIRSVIDRSAPFHAAEYATPDGDAWFGLRATPIDPGPGRVLVVRSDITARKKAEAVLAESEERYRSLMMAMADGVVLQDETAAIVAFNASALRILGLTADQLAGRTSFDPRWCAIHEDGSPFHGDTHPAVETLRTGEARNDVLMGIHKPDGDLTWISVSVQPLFKHGRPKPWRVVATMHDVTEQRRAGQDAAVAMAMIKAQFDLSPDGMLVVDQHGVRRSYNRRYMEMWGLTEAILESTDHGAVRLRQAQSLADPQAFLARIEEIDADPTAPSYDELELLDGRTIERYSAPVRLEIGEIRGRAWYFRDITERLKSAADQSLLAAVVNSTPDGIISVDLDGVVTTWNGGAERMLGFTAEETIGRDGRLRAPDGSLSALKDIVMAQIRTGIEVGYLEDRRLRKDGSPVDLSVVFSSVRDRDGDIIGGVFIGRDVTERKRDEAELIRMARFDSLTGLLNRTSLAAALAEAIERPRDHDAALAVILMDVDHFKDINDTLGYLAGDRLLIALAERIGQTVADIGVVARFSANAFAILLENVSGGSELEAIAWRLLQAVAEPLMLDGSPIRIGASMGIATAGREATNAGTLLAEADIALHRAKRESPGKFMHYTRAMDEAVHLRMQLGSELRAAVDAGQFVLHYQPQADAEHGRIIGAEALIRWRHPERGLVSAARFMPLAERLGLAPGIGRWVIDETCRQIRLWLDAGISPPPVAVNLSAMQFSAPGDLERDLEEAIDRHDLTPQRLELELTETVLMDSRAGYGETLARLRARGFSLSIDDFGTGYSSFDYLRRFPVDRIKIDQTFVRDLDLTPVNEAIIRAVIGLAEKLGIKVIAEGVETEIQRDLLRRWNCLCMQGYYFSRPLEAAVITDFLANDQRLPVLSA